MRSRGGDATARLCGRGREGPVNGRTCTRNTCLSNGVTTVKEGGKRLFLWMEEGERKGNTTEEVGRRKQTKKRKLLRTLAKSAKKVTGFEKQGKRVSDPTRSCKKARCRQRL